ncbi:cytochrome P450 [Pleomassaria siparia CBS 279.74]|uniref:Cytochrome P450 n=1 Tax=Pleomassaria siparia CBS 279.74 TaxID=1314801 RepID=A0A6G1JVQ3_9PLEO|nr:cytochrome P450 [Pleomassaria siparia CBS 279.74]
MSFSIKALYDGTHQLSYSAIAVVSIIVLLIFKDSIISVLLERWNAWVYLFRGAHMVQSAYDKASSRSRPHHSQSYNISGPDNDHIFVSSKQAIHDINRAKRDELSLQCSFTITPSDCLQMFQPAYTMLGHNWKDERGAEGIGYVRAVGTLLPNQLLKIMPDMWEYAQSTFDKLFKESQAKTGSNEASAYDLMKHTICKLNGHMFFGTELGANEVFMSTVFQYNEIVLNAAEVLRIMPEWLKSIVGPLIKRYGGIQQRVFSMLNEVVIQRLEDKKNGAPEPNDLIQWIINTAPKDGSWTPGRITYEVITIWFGSVHALSSTTAFAIFDLCQHQEYIQPLRAEIEGPEFEALLQTTRGMPLLDSFIKESIRMNPMEAMAGRRQALKPFSFSDGTKLAKGDWTCVPVKAMLHDAQYFPDPLGFNGFRFVSPEQHPETLRTITQPEGPSRAVDISPNFHYWGIGGIVCPGRFYVAVAMKLVLAHILQNYDIDLVDKDAQQSDIWRTYILPKEKIQVRFTPRAI